MAVSRYASEVTDARVLRIWWAVLWRGTLFGGIVAWLVGAVVSAAAIMNRSSEIAESAASMAGYVVTLPISFWVLKLALRKQYRGFALRIVPDDGVEVVASSSAPVGSGTAS